METTIYLYRDLCLEHRKHFFYNLGLSKNRMAQLSKDAKTKSQQAQNNYTVQKEFKLFFCHKQGWLNWQHAGLRSQRSKFKPHLGQISMNKFVYEPLPLKKNCKSPVEECGISMTEGIRSPPFPSMPSIQTSPKLKPFNQLISPSFLNQLKLIHMPLVEGLYDHK